MHIYPVTSDILCPMSYVLLAWQLMWKLMQWGTQIAVNMQNTNKIL